LDRQAIVQQGLAQLVAVAQGAELGEHGDDDDAAAQLLFELVVRVEYHAPHSPASFDHTVRPGQCRGIAGDHRTGRVPAATRAALIRLKGRLPRNPVVFIGLGWPARSTTCRSLVTNGAFAFAAAPQST